MPGLTFVCLAAVALHGDTLRCSTPSAGDTLVRLAGVERADVAGEQGRRSLAPLLSGAVWCQQVDADPRAAGFQAEDAAGRVVARCKAQGRDLSTALLAGAEPAKARPPAGQWGRQRLSMTTTWLLGRTVGRGR